MRRPLPNRSHRRPWYRLDFFRIWESLSRLREFVDQLFDLNPSRLTSDRRPSAKPELLVLEPRALLESRPFPLPVIYAGSGEGMSPTITAYSADTGEFKFSKEVYASSFTGGVRVATADFNLDGYPDLLVGPGPNGGPNVKIIDGKSGDQIPGPLGSFWAFDPSFTGGVNVAAADVDGDGVPDVIVAAGPGGGPRVRIFSGRDGSVIADFFALDPNFRGGITIAAADFTGSGKAQVVIGAGAGGGPQVKVINPLTQQPIAGSLGSFFAFDPSFRGGVLVGTNDLANDVNGDGVPDLAIGSGPDASMATEVKVYSGADGSVLQDFTPFGSFTGGATVALSYVDNDNKADIVVGSGAGMAGTVRVYSGDTGEELSSPMGEYAPFGSATGGVSVASSNDPANISAMIFYDLNSNGIYDGGSETLPSGIAVTLWLSGTQIDSGTTIFGSVIFSGLAFNTNYQIDAVAPGGYTDEGPVTINTGSSGGFGYLGLSPASPPPPPPPPPPLAISGFSSDTGASSSDRLTNDTTLTIFGTAPGSSTVTVDDRFTTGTDVRGGLGSVTASAGGLWTLTYGTALAEGTHNLTAVDNGATSIPYQITIDTTSPTVILKLDPAASPYSTAPQAFVTASDLWGFGATTTVTLDVDLNNDGDYSDPGETGYATAAFKFGRAVFSGYTPLSAGSTVRMRARVSDAAGNEGASTAVNVTPATAPNTWIATSTVPPTVSSYGVGADGLSAAGDVMSAATLALSAPSGNQNNLDVYNSLEANPKAVFQASIQSDSALGVPSQVVTTLTLDGSFAATSTRSGTGLTPGDNWVFALQPSSALSTGRHTFTLDLFVDYPGSGNDQARSITGSTFAVNRSSSPFGAGWSYSNVDSLTSISASGSLPAGILRAYGQGGWAFYPVSGGGYGSPVGDAGTLSAMGGGGYKYTSATGEVETFDSSGRMTSWVSSSGTKIFTYTYDGGGKLAAMASPDGGLATFTYNGSNQVSTIADPSGITTFAYTGSDLTAITDPAGGQHTFAYDGSDHLLSETQGVLQRSYTYSNGMAATIKVGSGSAQTIVPAAAAGLGANSSGAIRGSVTNEVGADPMPAFDAQGQPVSQLAADGGYTTLNRDSNGYVTGIIDPLGRMTTHTLNAVGETTVSVAPGGGTSSFTYDTGSGFNSLLTATDPLGGTSTYSYTGAGQVQTVTNPNGGITTLTWNGDGTLQSFLNPLGQRVTAVYDTHEHMVGELIGGVSTGTVSYDAAGRYTGAIDALGNRTTVVNDALGRPLTIMTPDGSTTTNVYDASGLVLSTTEPNGVTNSYAYDSAGRQTEVIRGFGSGSSEITTTVYDAAGEPIATVDPLGNRTTSVFDGQGRVIAVTDPLGNVTQTQYDLSGNVSATIDPLGRITQNDYDDSGRQVSVTDPLGNITTTVYDADGHVIANVDSLGNRTTSVYDDQGRMIATVDPLGNRSTTVYDANSQAIASIDPLGHRTTSVYDASGRVAATQDALGNFTTSTYDYDNHVIATTDGLGHISSTVYDSSGRVSSTIDPLGDITTTVYDDAGRVSATIDPLGNVTTTVYDSFGRVSATIDAIGNRTTRVYDASDRVIGTIDPLGNITTSVYDNAGRIVATVDPLGHRSTTTYDAAGEVLSTTNPLNQTTLYGYDGDGRQVSITDPLGNVSTTVYDDDGRVIATIDPLGARTTTIYDSAGRTVATIDALNHRSTTTYDAAGNAVAQTDPLNHTATTVYDALNRSIATIDALGDRSTTTYDADGHAIATVGPLGNTTTIVYDAAGHTIATVDPLGNRSTNVYDAAGDSIATVDALGNRTTSVFDADHRVSTIIDPLGNQTTTTYDADGRTLAVIDPLNHRVTFGYDAAGRKTSTLDSLERTWQAVYNDAGSIVATINPLGNRTTTIYDDAGRVVATVDALGNSTTTVYDAASRSIATVDALGNRTTSVYDDAGRSIATVDALGNRSTTVYDDGGNAIATIDSLNNRTTTIFDSLNRTIATIDALGDTSTVVYDATGNAIAHVDALGRRTTTTYDSANRSVGIMDALGNRSTTVYDAVGNVIAQIDALGQRTTSVYDARNHAIESIDPLGNISTSVYDSAGNQIARVDARGERSTSTYDALNRVVETVDALGDRTTSLYDEAGRMTTSIDPLGNRATVVYDADNRQVETDWPPATAFDLSLSRSTNVYDAIGERVATIDTLGHRTTSVFDADKRLIASVDALGNRTTSVYDAAGNVVAQIDARGDRSTSVYDAINRTIATIDALGDLATTSYDAAGNRTVSIDSLGNRTSFSYDELGRQIEQQDALGNRTTSVYEVLGRQVAQIDALGHRTTSTYDAAGRIIETVDALGDRTTTGYDAAGNAIVVVDPLGNRTTSVYDELNRQSGTIDALGNRTTAVYDAAGHRTVAIDALNLRTTSVFDGRGRLSSTVDPLGNITTAVYDAAGNRIAAIDPLGQRTTSGYDALNRSVAVTDPLGNTSTTTYDAAGNALTRTDARGFTTTSVYDAVNRLVATVDPLGNRSTSVYDAAGEVIATIDPRGDRSTTVYASDHRAIANTDALGDRSTSVYDAAGRTVATIDALGNISTSVYDPAGRQIGTIDALGNKTTSVYDAAGRLTSRTDENGFATTSVYDAVGREVATIDPLGNRATSVYDADGRLTTTIDPLGDRTTFSYDADSRQISRTDALNHTTTSVYDAAGRTVKTIDPLGNTTTSVYDAAGHRTRTELPSGALQTVVYDAAGNATVSIDGLAHRTTQTFDGDGRVTTITDPLGGLTTYSYDASGNRTVVIDPSGNLTSTSYDAANRISQDSDPSGHTETFSYDAVGREVSTTDRLGQRSDFTFDALGHNLSEYWYAFGGTFLGNFIYTYDPAGNRLTAENAVGSYTFTYDAENRVATAVEPYGQTLTFAYDANGNRTVVQDSFGGLQTSTYDAVGDLLTRAQSGNGGDLKAVYTYTARGQVASIARYSDAAGATFIGDTQNTYDAGGRETRQQFRDSTSTPISTITYTYDLADRLSTQIDNGSTTTYSYDAAGELLADGATTHSYDASGNRTDAGYHTGIGNQTTTDGVWTYSYDLAGNRIKKSMGASADTWTYAYDLHNHLTRVEERATDGGTLLLRIDYSYDAFGNLIRRTQYDGSLSVVSDAKYALDGWKTTAAGSSVIGNDNFDVWADLDASNALTTRRVYGDRIDEPLARITSAGVEGWYLADRQGSVRYVTNGSGVVQATVTYDGFGKVLSNTNSSATDRYGYVGRETDTAAGGLVEMRDRWLSLDLGDFLSRDRMGFGGGDTTLTRYVHNDFPNMSDPSGMLPPGVRPVGPTPDMSDWTYEQQSAWLNAHMSAGANTIVMLPGDPPPLQAVNNNTNTLFGVDMTGVDTAVGDFLLNTKFGSAVTTVDTALQNLADLARMFQSRMPDVLNALQDRPISILTTLGNGLQQGFQSFLGSLPSRGPRMVGGWVLGISDTSTLDSLSGIGSALLDKAGLSGDALWNMALSNQKVSQNVGLVLNVYHKLAGGAATADNIISMMSDKTDGIFKSPNDFIQQVAPVVAQALTNQVVSAIPGLVAKFVPGIGAIQTAVDLAIGFAQSVPTMTGAVQKLIDGVDNLLAGDSTGLAGKVQAGLEASFPAVATFAASFLHFDPKKMVSDSLGMLRDKAKSLMDQAIDKIIPQTTMPLGGNPLGVVATKDQTKLWVVAGASGPVIMVQRGTGQPTAYAGTGKDAAAVLAAATKVIADQKQLKAAAGKASGGGAGTGMRPMAAGGGGGALQAEVKQLSDDTNALLKPQQALCDGLNGNACFGAGTPLLIPGGSKLIETFVAGDIVLSRSEFDPWGPLEAKLVEEVFERHSRVMDARINGRWIKTTPEHPFWPEGRGWTAAECLCVGDRVLGNDGGWHEVEELRFTDELATVYNMRIADHHTYFVGCEEWGFAVWAHNAYDQQVDPGDVAGLPVDVRNAIIRASSERAARERTVAVSGNSGGPIPTSFAGNFMVVQAETRSGVQTKVTFGTRGSANHSEPQMLDWFKSSGVSSVKAAFSEHVPCRDCSIGPVPDMRSLAGCFTVYWAVPVGIDGVASNQSLMDWWNASGVYTS